MEPSTKKKSGKKKRGTQPKQAKAKGKVAEEKVEKTGEEGSWLNGDNLVVEDAVAVSIVQELKDATYVDFEKKGELGHWDMSGSARRWTGKRRPRSSASRV